MMKIILIAVGVLVLLGAGVGLSLIHISLILTDGECIRPLDIQFEQNDDYDDQAGFDEEKTGRLDTDLKSRESEMILEALNSHNGNRKAASETLGISPRTLRYKLSRMRERGIDIPESGGGTANAA